MSALQFKSVAIKAAASLLLLLALAEVATRLSGITDMPTYAVDGGIGYIANPGQAGRFMDRNAWSFNARSMPTADEWNPHAKPNVMLIGNSVIMGGNSYDQKDKVTPLLKADLHDAYSLWPLAVGGWTNVNEIAYLERNPDVVKATDFFLWEYMSGGLSMLSQWRGEYVFPTKRPWLASWYAFRRYVAPRFFSFNMNELPPTGDPRADHIQDFKQWLTRLRNATGAENSGIIFAYPTKREFEAYKSTGTWLPEKAFLSEVCEANGLELVDIAESKDWNDSLYRDGVHPNLQGNVVLARILADAISGRFVPAHTAKNSP